MIEQTCSACGQSDTDPKHLMCFDATATAFHFDCHAHADPTCASCAEQVKAAHGVTGDAFRAHLLRTGE